MEIKCCAIHEDTPILFCSPPCSCIFADKVDVTGKRVLENSLLKLPVPDLLWQRGEGLCKHFHSLWAAKDILPPHLPSLRMPLPLGAQAGSSSLQVGAIWGEDLALLRCLCGCSQQDYFHSKCVIAVNKRDMGGVAGAVWTIKGNASALHMLWRGRVSVCQARGDVVRDRVWRAGVCMKTRGEESIWGGGGGRSKGVGTGPKRMCMAIKRGAAWKGLVAGCVWEDCKEEMWGRMSVGGTEMDAAPAPCCQTEHSIPDALPAFSNPMDYTVILPC